MFSMSSKTMYLSTNKTEFIDFQKGATICCALFLGGAEMTLEQIKDDVEKVIAGLSESIAQEEKAKVKSANYSTYQERLKEAESLRNEVQNDIERNFAFGADLHKMKLDALKMPIA